MGFKGLKIQKGGKIAGVFLLTLSIPCYSPALMAQQLYEKVKNSVFTIYSMDYPSPRFKTRGSAVAISKNILASNCHLVLVGNYSVVKVNGKEQLIRLIYKNNKEDLCLLEVPKANFSPVKIRASRSVRIGEVVYAIGNPQGSEKSLSQGLISNRIFMEGNYWLQTDAVIYFGSSGGGLFDEEGNLVGITTKMGRNFTFALPTERILSLVQPHSLFSASP